MKSLLIGVVALLTVGCDKTYFITQPSPTPATTATGNPVNTDAKIEFRVFGNANSVRIRYSAPADGLNQTVTTLPFVTSFNTDQKTLFLTLEVTPLSWPALIQPFLNAQIVVNGNLFKEASSTDFLLGSLNVNGTWRK